LLNFLREIPGAILAVGIDSPSGGPRCVREAERITSRPLGESIFTGEVENLKGFPVGQRPTASAQSFGLRRGALSR